jgi:hypothetical protein
MESSLWECLQVDEDGFTSSEHDSVAGDDTPAYERVPYDNIKGGLLDTGPTPPPDVTEYGEEATGDGLPPLVGFDTIIECPDARPFLVDGLLHVGDKLLITSRSKAGKSMLLIQLALSVANGGEWLGHTCNKGHVLYLNLELNETEFFRRVFRVLDATGQKNPGDALQVWNLRGKRIRPLDDFTEKFIGRVECQGFDLIVIDPFYKLADGIENAAEDVAEALLRIDAIAEAARASVVYAHHHAKGSQANRSVLDRGSGSGVFARDADVLLDLIELDPGSARDARLNRLIDKKGSVDDALALTQAANYWTAWRLQGISRNLPPLLPHNIWFDYPVHVPDDGLLDDARVMVSGGDDTSEGKYETRRHENSQKIIEAYEQYVNETSEDPTAYDLAEILGIPSRTLKDHLRAAGFESYKKGGAKALRYRQGGTDV